MVRSKASRKEIGDKPRKYFLGQESRNYLNKSKSLKEDYLGRIIDKQGDILEDVQRYYKSLWTLSMKLVQ